MAEKIFTAQELREHLKGKIVLKNLGNFVLPGFEDIILAAMPRVMKRAAAEARATHTVTLRLALNNRVDPNDTSLTPPILNSQYHLLDRVPVIPTEAKTPPPATPPYSDHATYRTQITRPPSNVGYWFTQSFTVPNVPDNSSLIDVVKAAGNAAASYITFPGGAGDISDDFLFFLNFGGDGTTGDEDHRFGGDIGIYSYDPSTGKGYWEGWGWMYFIGLPVPANGSGTITGQPQPYGDSGLPTGAYPGLALNQYLVARLMDGTILPEDPFPTWPGGGNGTFTLSYEKTWVSFTAISTVENGETVYTINCTLNK